MQARRTRRWAWALGLIVTLSLGGRASATWPPSPDASVAELRQPANWPNDPGYGLLPTDRSARGEWFLWSWVPEQAIAQPGFRFDEVSMGAGTHVDAAWALTIGDPRVLIAVLDSGIQWDYPDLSRKVALNPGELPRPHDASGTVLAYDANADGVFNIEDYANDPRIACGTSLPHPLDTCRDANGANDPNANGIFDAGDLIRTFSDGTDDDANGYVDDIAGWDFFKDDNDPYDDTRFGHGTGEANDSVAQTNNGRERAGVCPRCMFVPLRVGDSFVTDSNDFAQAVVYAADVRYGDNGVSVIQEALGTLNTTRFALDAIDYAYAHGLVVMASMGDENSRHHNAPATANHTVPTHANVFDGSTMLSSTTFLAFNNCTNYGAQLQLSVAAATCSSGATGFGSGIAGLIYSAGLQANLDPPLSAEEVRQVFIATVDDINVPESQPTHPYWNRAFYPSGSGWDQRFGYGRANARTAVEWVLARRIPPEVDIVSPRWFQRFDPSRANQTRLRIEGRIAARRAPSFSYAIAWARGVEPVDSAFRVLRAEDNVTAPVTGTLAELDLTDLVIDNPGEVENRYALTVRIRATSNTGVVGEARRLFYVERDPDALPGFPLETLGSVESSPHTVDLNGDGRAEIVVVSSDGRVHALQADGSELAGFPVHTGADQGFDTTRTPSYRGARAYAGANPAIDPDRIYESVDSTPAIGDLDGDGNVELVVGGYHGSVHVWNHDGTPYGHGFPRRLPDVPSADTNPHRIIDRNIFGSPVLYDLDGDGNREILVGAGDAKIYVFDSRTAADHPGFPVLVHFPEPNVEYGRLFGSLGVGRMDGDSIPDIVAVSNERPEAWHVAGEDDHGGDPNWGSVYVIHGDGNLHAGGPYHANWPIAVTSFDFFPLVGTGLSASPAIADVDNDGRDDLSLTGTGLPTMIIAHGEQPPHGPRPETLSLARVSVLESARRGPLSNTRGNSGAFMNAFSLGAFGDLSGDGHLEYIMSGAGLALAINLAGGGKRTDFEHQVGAWDSVTGQTMPGWPRVIEDYTFFQNPAVADVSGDEYPEVVIGTGGYYVHAIDACGREAPGFPKFTGQWVIPSPSIADIDGDGHVDVATATRAGWVYAWRTHGRVDGNTQWPTFRHDPANTGNYGSPLDHGTRTPAGIAPIVCPVADAGVPAADAGATVTPSARGGCGCAVPGGSSRGRRSTGASLALLGAVLAVRARRSGR